MVIKQTLLISFISLLLTLAACQTGPDTSQPDAQADNKGTQTASDNTPGLASRTLSQTRTGLGDAALAPLKDLNLHKDPIPEALRAIKNPYDVADDLSCAEIESEVETLNTLLGRDWDIPPPDKKKLTEKAADGASTAFLDTITSEATGLIPYRGVVRTVSGAERHARKKRQAYERGSHRRTFLKGLGKANGCAYPAAPQLTSESETDTRIDFR